MTQETDCLILRPKKWPAIWLLLASGMLVVAGCLLAQLIGWKGYLLAGFCALGIPVAIVQLLPGSAYLRIAHDGLTFANMFRVTKISWNVVDHFFVISLKQFGLMFHKLVGFNFVPSYDRGRIGRRIRSAIAHCEGALPDTYGLNAEELADILNTCLERFSERHGEQVDEPEPE